MTAPPYTELVAAVRREGEGIVAAAGVGLDAPVPSCEGWDVADLVGHVCGVYARITRIVGQRLTEAPSPGTVIPDGEPIDVLRITLDGVVDALAGCETDTPVWNWDAGSPQVAEFWARRMAHESAVHRYDAQSAHDMTQPIDDELASDGIDELIDVVAGRVYARDNVTGPTGTLTLSATDGSLWHLRLEPDGPLRLEALDDADAIVTAGSSALLLAAYGRVTWRSLDVTGDVDLLDRWSAALNF